MCHSFIEILINLMYNYFTIYIYISWSCVAVLHELTVKVTHQVGKPPSNFPPSKVT